MATPDPSDLMLYRAPDGAVRAEVRYEGDTFWLSQRQMAEHFGVEVQTVIHHLKKGPRGQVPTYKQLECRRSVTRGALCRSMQVGT